MIFDAHFIRMAGPWLRAATIPLLGLALAVVAGALLGGIAEIPRLHLDDPLAPVSGAAMGALIFGYATVPVMIGHLTSLIIILIVAEMARSAGAIRVYTMRTCIIATAASLCAGSAMTLIGLTASSPRSEYSGLGGDLMFNLPLVAIGAGAVCLAGVFVIVRAVRRQERSAADEDLHRPAEPADD